MRLMPIAATVLLTLQGATAALSDESASATLVAQPRGTWNLKLLGVPKQGLLIAAGPHRGKFQPCNSTDYFTVNPANLSPNPAPCGPPDTVLNPHPHPVPYAVLDSKPFVNSTLTADTPALAKLLASNPSKSRDLLQKINAGTISSPTDLKKDPLFAKLVIKKVDVTPL